MTPAEANLHAIAALEAERDRLREALKSLFQWCESTVPYFGENWRGSYADAVYTRAAKALDIELNDAQEDR